MAVNRKWEESTVRSMVNGSAKAVFSLPHGNQAIVSNGILNGTYNVYFKKGGDTIALTLGQLTTVLNHGGVFYG